MLASGLSLERAEDYSEQLIGLSYEEPPVYDCPEGYSITAPQLNDAPVITEVHARAFEEAYVGIHPRNTPERLRAFVRNPSPEGFYNRIYKYWGTTLTNPHPDPYTKHRALVARKEPAGTIVGVAACRTSTNQRYSYAAQPMDNPTHLVTALYIDPDYQHRGIGTALLHGIMRHLGLTVVLETVHGTAAVEFYKKHGFTERPWLAGVVGPPWNYNGLQLHRLAMSHDNY